MVKKKAKKTTSTRKKGITSYERDNSGLKGKATDFFKPKNAQELKDFVKKNSKVCIRGGGTGMMGGCIPQNEMVLDMTSLEKIEHLDSERMNVEVECGITLESLQKYLAKFELEFPFKILSDKKSTIGGMIATNSSGIRGMKYGKISDWVNWIEVINPDGNSERKARIELSDYAGMEGITGVIYKANLKLIPKINRTAQIIEKDYIHEIMNEVKRLKTNLKISAIELLDKRISEYLALPFKYHLIIEYESEEGDLKGEDYDETMNLLFLAYNVILNREKSYRIEDYKLFLDRFDKVFSFVESFDIPIFASVSSGIIHPCISEENEKLIPEIVGIVKKLGGNIHGTYGIGLRKKEFLEFSDRRLILNMKKRLDEKNKFNSRKVVDYVEEKSFTEKSSREKAKDFVNKLDVNDKVVIITHDDLDGLTSGILLYDVVENKIGKVDIKFFSYNQNREDFDISNYNIILISDLAPSLLENIFKKSEGKKLLYFDHHQKNAEIPENTLEVREEDGMSCSRIVYETFGGKEWLGAAGLIDDAGDKYEINKKFIADFCQKENITLKELKDKYVFRLGKLLVYFQDNPQKPFELIKKMKDFRDLNDLEQYILPIENEVEKTVLEYETKKEILGKVNFFIFEPKYGIKSVFINKMSFANPKEMFVFLIPFMENYRISFRAQEGIYNGIKILEDCGAEKAGGHMAAAGGAIKKEFLEQFKENLRNYDYEKARLN